MQEILVEQRHLLPGLPETMFFCSPEPAPTPRLSRTICRKDAVWKSFGMNRGARRTANMCGSAVRISDINRRRVSENGAPTCREGEGFAQRVATAAK